MSSFKDSLFFKYILLFVLMFLGLIIAESCNMFMEKIFAGRALLLSESVLQNIFAFLLPVCILFNYDFVRYLGIGKRFDFRALFCAILIFIISYPLMEYIISVNANMQFPAFLTDFKNSMLELEHKAQEMTDCMLKVSGFGQLIVNILIVGVLTGFCEEVFFRGGIQKLFIQSKFNHHIAIWVAALIFSLMHFQILGFIPRLLIGAFFGYLFYWNGSIWLNSALHAFNNSLVVIFYWLIERGCNLNPDNLFGLNSTLSIILAVISLIFTALLFYYGKRYIVRRNG